MQKMPEWPDHTIQGAEMNGCEKHKCTPIGKCMCCHSKQEYLESLDNPYCITCWTGCTGSCYINKSLWYRLKRLFK